MKKELLEFALKNYLSPFRESQKIEKENKDIFKTRDAKAVSKKVFSKISSNFIFQNTQNLFDFFPFISSIEEINKRREFFQQIEKNQDNSFIKDLKKPKQWWKPKYDVLAVTEDEKTFVEISKLSCPIKFLSSQEDLSDLIKYDLIQAIDCDEFNRVIETLPQSMIIDSIDDIYLERYLEQLSGWTHNINILLNNESNSEIKEYVEKLSKLLNLLETKESQKISKLKAEQALEEINEKISKKLKEMTFSGGSLFSMLSKGQIPKEIEEIISKSISEENLPHSIFTNTIPVAIDEQELDNLIKKQNADEFTDLAIIIQRNANEIKSIPKEIEKLEAAILLFDFSAGISKFISNSKDSVSISENIAIENSINLMLDSAQPVSFHLNQENKCSILTGANSGGKTTLIEHIIHLITLSQLGIPITGKVSMPLFTEVYYFAKTKGSANKGAFETLLTQMSKINPGKNTIILADEIEAVTEPGVAGIIVSATADYFIQKDCFLIIATHLGQDIQKVLPKKARIDGIEAKGLDENFDLIIDHNPVLGRLAHSTPELIVEKMASSAKTSNDYLVFINNFLKNK